MREFDMPITNDGRSGSNDARRLPHQFAREDVLALVFELTQMLSLVIAISPSFPAYEWLQSCVTPFLPLTVMIIRIAIKSTPRRRRSAVRGDAGENG